MGVQGTLMMPATRLCTPPRVANGTVVPVRGGVRVASQRHPGCVVHVAMLEMQRGRSSSSSRGRFAALSGSEAVEVAQLGSNTNSGSGEEGARGEGLVSTVGTPAPGAVGFQEWYMADKQLMVISFTAFVTAGFMAILVTAAIPSLLAIKKAAEALERLADTAREELPGTMAAIRLSGMEISDLTMELNDLGQEISKGVRSSARVLSNAESGMRPVGVASNGTGSRSSSSNAATGGPHRKTNA